MSPGLTYVLVTPARDEAAYIERTIDSVVGQTVRPLRWVIVSDGSTDGTEAIVERRRARHGWIELVTMPARGTRHFGGKVAAFNAGLARVAGLGHDLLGCLDADVSFGADHFEFLLERFADDPRLGVGGTPLTERGAAYDYRFSSADHVSGFCQLFRRECFEDIGGYLPLEGGGIDVVAVTAARMKGWHTRSFVERSAVHHRPTGSATRGEAAARFRHGEQDYRLGGHPLWQVCRALYQMTRPPRIVGGGLLLCGYLWAMLRRQERPVSADLIRFRRREQMTRLRRFIGG